MPSVFFPDLKSNDKLLALSGEEFHHLVRVSRTRVNDVIRLNSGDGSLAEAKVIEIGKREAILELISIRKQIEFPAPFAIAFALLKNRHDEFLVEKCTELGVERFFPLVSEFTIRKSGAEGIRRLERVALAAIKQCDNPILPRLELPQTPAMAIKRAGEMGYRPILCSELLPGQWLSDMDLSPSSKPCFFIGPEGGWSEKELSLFQVEGLPQVSIAYLITRAETAAITIASQWLAYANRFNTSGTT